MGTRAKRRSTAARCVRREVLMGLVWEVLVAVWRAAAQGSGFIFPF